MEVTWWVWGWVAWKTDGGHIGQTFKVAFDLGRLAEFIVKSHIKAKIKRWHGLYP